jgi:hypothetical protein
LGGFSRIVDGYNRTSDVITKNFQITQGNIYDDPSDPEAEWVTQDIVITVQRGE